VALPAPPTPRGPYQVIAESLRDQIRSGELKPGDALPTIAQLAVTNNVAVGTAHRALTVLRDEGLIDVTRGRRAIVATGPADRSPSDFGAAGDVFKPSSL